MESAACRVCGETKLAACFGTNQWRRARILVSANGAGKGAAGCGQAGQWPCHMQSRAGGRWGARGELWAWA